MGNVLYRQVNAEYPTAARASGIYIFDSNGKEYIDGSGGAAVTCIGHGHPRVLSAIQEQAAKLGYIHTSYFTSEPAETLAKFLTDRAPGDLNHVHYTSSGSEAVEVALKSARQFFVETGKPEKTHFISRRQSYHGNSLGALAVGGSVARREMFSPMFMSVSQIAPCYSYRYKNDGESDEQYGRRVADELETEILKRGPEKVAAFIAEPVVGATIGAAPAVPGYFTRISEICKKFDVLLILDEVMCGMGRTGTYFACEQEGVVPDLLCIAKGLGGGYQPIGAVLLADKIFEGLATGSQAFLNGQTYNGHPIACAAALATQQVIEDEGLIDKVNERGKHLTAALYERFGNHSHIGNIRGRGLFQAFEFVQDRISKKPFESAKQIATRLKAEAIKNGLLVYTGSGTADGKLGDHVLLAPPFISTDSQIDEIIARLGRAVDTVLTE